MDKSERDRIKKFVGLRDADTAKTLVKYVLVMAFSFPVCIFSILLQTGDALLNTLWKYVLALYVVMILWSIYILFNIKNKLIQFYLHSTFVSFVISITFFGFYYTYIYKIIDKKNPLYLIVAVIGYFLIVCSLFYYRYRILVGKSKNLSGSPKYGIIVSVTIVGGSFVKLLTQNMGKDLKNLLIAFVSLFISYAFSAGIVSIYNYFVALKYKDILKS